MTLTWPVLAAVLFGALLHASWNALVKSSADKALDTAVIHLIGSLITVPFGTSSVEQILIIRRLPW